MKNRGIKRIFKRIREELKSTIRISKVVGIKKAFNTLIAKVDIQIMNHNGYYENETRKRHLLKKHKTMLEYIEHEYSTYINNYDFKNVELIKKDKKNLDKIWICWWQGLDNAPEIVKICVNSIKKNAGKHDVIVIDESNYKNYIDFPDWLIDKYNKNIISKTHFSDLLRLEILSRYGGLWIDSTFYCIDNIEEYFDMPIWSIKRPEYFHASVASGYFANYSLGCQFEYRRSFRIFRDFLIEYWKNNDEIVDYLLTDYIIKMIIDNDKETKELFNNIPNNNDNCDELFKKINDKYDEKEWNDIKHNTKMFKLSWKYKFKESNKNEKTFYGKLIYKKL